MANNIFRNLDMLAGETGKVMYGENARKERLLAGIQQRSQEQSMLRQRGQQAQSLQEKRLFSYAQTAEAKLLEDKRQFNEEMKYQTGADKEKFGLSGDRIAAINRRTAFEQKKAEKDKVAKEFEFFDESLDQLNNKYRMVAAAVEEGSATKQDLQNVQDEFDRMTFAKDEYFKRVVSPEVQNVLETGRAKFDSIREKKLKQLFGRYQWPYGKGKNIIGTQSYPEAKETAGDRWYIRKENQ